jgi:hypothetical protein
VIVPCECGRKLKPRADMKAEPGQQVILTCPCGQKVRFRVPAPPQMTEKERREKIANLFRPYMSGQQDIYGPLGPFGPIK